MSDLKRNTLSKCCLIIALSGVSISAGATWLTNIKIGQITTRPDGGFVITLPASNNGGCPNSKAIALPGKNAMTQAGVDSSLAVSLAAFSAGKLVNINQVSDGANCWMSAITISQ